MPGKTYHGYRKQMKKRLHSSSLPLMREQKMKLLKEVMGYTIRQRLTSKGNPMGST